MTTVAVVTASLFEIIPTFVIKSNVPTIASVTPYTPLEVAGREEIVARGGDATPVACHVGHRGDVRQKIPHAGCIDELTAVGQAVEQGRAGGMPAFAAAVNQAAGEGVCLRNQGIDE